MPYRTAFRAVWLIAAELCLLLAWCFHVAGGSENRTSYYENELAFRASVMTHLAGVFFVVWLIVMVVSWRRGR